MLGLLAVGTALVGGLVLLLIVTSPDGDDEDHDPTLNTRGRAP